MVKTPVILVLAVLMNVTYLINMEFTFWDEQWRKHTGKETEQGRKTPSSEDSTSYDPKGPWRHEQIHKKNKTQG